LLSVIIELENEWKAILLTLAVWDLVIILSLLFVKSKTDKVPVEVPQATKDES